MSTFANLGSIRAVFVADVRGAIASIDSFSSKIAAAAATTEGALRNIAGKFSTINTLVGAGFATAAFSKFKELDKSLMELRQVLNQTEGQFASTQKQIVDFANATRIPLAAVSEATRRFVIVNNTVPDSLTLVKVAAMGARANLTEVANAADVLNTAMRSFRVPITDAQRVMGQLSIATETTRASFDDIGFSIAQIGPTAAALGSRLEDTLGILRLFVNETGSIGEATAKYRAILQELAGIDPVSKQGEAIRKVLGTTIEASFETRGFIETIKLLIAAAGGSEQKLRELVGTGRTLIAFTRLMRQGFDELDASIGRFANVSTAELVNQVAAAKSSVVALLKEFGKLTTNAIQTAFLRNATAIRDTIRAVNDFVTRNRELVATVVEIGLKLSLVAVGLGVVKAGLLAAAVGVKFFADAMKLVRGAVLLADAAISGQFLTTLGAMVPKLKAAGDAIKTFAVLQYAAFTSSVSKSGPYLVLAGQAGTLTTRLAQLSTIMGKVAFTSLPALATGAFSSVAGFAALSGGIAAAIGVGYLFYNIGRRIGDALFTTRDATNSAREAIDRYNASVTESAKSLAEQGKRQVSEKQRLESITALIKEQADLRKRLSKEQDPAQRIELRRRIDVTGEDLGKLGEANPQDSIKRIQNQIEAGRKAIARERSKAAGVETEKPLPGIGPDTLARIETINKESDAYAKQRAPLEALIALYTKKGLSEADARAAAEADIKQLNNLRVIELELAKAKEDSAETDKQAVTSRGKVTNAMAELAAKQQKAAESLQAFDEAVRDSEPDEYAKKINDLGDKSEVVKGLLDAVKKSIDTVNEAMATETDAAALDKQKSDLADLLKLQEDYTGKLAKVEEAMKRIAELSRLSREKASQDLRDKIDELNVSALRSAGLDDGASGASARSAAIARNQRIQEAERLRALARLKAIQVDDAEAIADEQIAAANRVYEAEMAAIKRAQKEKERNYAIASAVRQREEEDLRRADALARAAEANEAADRARKNGDVRTEIALRERAAKLISESADRTAELLERERALNRNTKDRLELLKDEVDTRLRLGQGGGGVAEASRGALRDIAGSDSATEFRGAFRRRLGDEQTAKGVGDLAEAVKSIIRGEFSGLQSARRQAARSGDSEKVAEIDKQLADVIERARITQQEVARALREVAKQGGGPRDIGKEPIVLPGSQVRPDEKVPPGVRVLGPATKDKDLIDDQKKFKADVVPTIKFPDTPLTIKVTEPLPVKIVSGGEAPGVEKPEAVKVKEAERVKEAAKGETEGGGRQSAMIAAISAAILSATSLAAKTPEVPKPEPVRNPAREAFVERQTAARAGEAEKKKARDAAELERQVESIRRTSTPKDAERKIKQLRDAAEAKKFAGQSSPEDPTIGDPTAPPEPIQSPPIAPAPEVVGPPAPPTVQPGATPDAGQLFKGVSDATAALGDSVSRLTEAIKANADAISSALGTVSGKLGTAVDQLNENTDAIKGIDAEVSRLRIEGRA